MHESHSGHFHSHAPSGNHPGNQQDKRSLGIALFITSFFMLVEVGTGFFANSLALLSDGLHMFGDVISLALNWGSLWLASRPRTSRYSYGFLRAEILGGFLSAMGLWVSSGFIVYEAIQRLIEPQPIAAPAVMGVAALGLCVNLIVLRMLHKTLHASHSHRDARHSHEENDSSKHSHPLTHPQSSAKKGSLSLRAAYLHVIADTMGSLGALAAGAVYFFTQWAYADSVASFLIAGMILFGSWQLVRESFAILMESVPSHIDGEAVKKALLSLPRIREVHDLHIWSLNSSQPALSAHLVTDSDTEPPPRSSATNQSSEDRYSSIIQSANRILRTQFGIQHSTLQIEASDTPFDCKGCG